MPRPSLLRRAVRVVGVALPAVAAAIYVQSERVLRRPVVVPVHAAPAAARFAATPEAHTALVARGARVAAARGCAGCHGANLGGQVLADDPAMGRLATPNLTAGGRGPALDDRAWELALRHGVRPDGAPLLVMPSGDYAAMTDDEVVAVAAYARSLPAVRTPPPALRVGPLLRVLSAVGKADIVPARRIAAEQGRRHGAGHVAHVGVAPDPRAHP
jgi:mono/diheme cytochrome c family protein